MAGIEKIVPRLLLSTVRVDVVAGYSSVLKMWLLLGSAKKPTDIAEKNASPSTMKKVSAVSVNKTLVTPIRGSSPMKSAISVREPYLPPEHPHTFKTFLNFRAQKCNVCLDNIPYFNHARKCTGERGFAPCWCCHCNAHAHPTLILMASNLPKSCVFRPD